MRRTTAFTMMAAASCCAAAFAGDTWDGGGTNNNWNNGNNWNPPTGFQFPPPNNGTANIHMAGTLRLTPLVNVPYSINSLTFDNNAGAFTILGAEELTIGAGGIVNNDTQMQSVIGPVKLAADQFWHAASGPLQFDSVNLNGFNLWCTGGFPISLPAVIHGSGGLVGVTGGVTATISGNNDNTYAGSTYVNSGTLVLQKTGGAIAVPTDLFINYQGGGSTVRLAGNEQISQAMFQDVRVYAGGLLDVNTRTETLDTLRIEGGSAATTGAGKLTARYAVVTGATATWSNNGALYVGESGSGTLHVINGGGVTSIHAYVGNLAGATGYVSVAGAGSTWFNFGSLNVGNAGIGSVNLSNSGHVEVKGNTIIDDNSQLTVDNATFDSLNLTVDGGSLSAASGGDVTLVAGVLRNGAELTLQTDAWLVQTGNLVLENGVTMQVLSGAQYAANHPDFGVMKIGTVPGPASEMIVDGAGTLVASNDAIDIGYGGTGIVTITGGARVQTGTGAIGSYDPNLTGSVGTVTIDGTAANGVSSAWISTYGLNMGLAPASDGTMNVINGGLYQAPNLYVGVSGSGHVLVNGTSLSGVRSRVDVSQLVFQNGAGNVSELTASNGGRIEADSVHTTTANGPVAITIKDPDSALLQSGLSVLTIGDVNGSPAATLAVLDGGSVTTGTGNTLINATGTLTIDGASVAGVFHANGPISVSGLTTVGDVATEIGGILDVNAGLMIDGGTVHLKQGVIDANSISLINGGILDLDGGTLHVDSLNGNLLNQAGTLAPGHSPGTTAISGNYTQQAGAKLQIEIDGVFPGDWDEVAVQGNALLGGTLEVVLLDGFQPVIGNSFTVLTTNVGNVAGTFASLNLPSGMTIAYAPKSVTLNMTSVPCPADVAPARRDGLVNVTDLLAVISAWGACAGCAADTNDDNLVNVTDLLAVISAWGACP